MDFSSCKNLLCVLILSNCYFVYHGNALTTNTLSQSIKDLETLSSNNGNFTLGFFSPENSTDRYLGIWCKSQLAVIWVANRNKPLNDSSGIVTVSEDGNLVILSRQKQVIWSTSVPNIASNSTFQLSDYGNLVLLENTTGNTLWESFQHPSDTFLPGMKLTRNKRTGEKMNLASWKSSSDPSIGSFTSSVERVDTPEIFTWNGTRPYWRSGPWNGDVFLGIPDMGTSYLNGLHFVNEGDGTVAYSLTSDEPITLIYVLSSEGQHQRKEWDDEHKEWQVTWTSKESDCDIYGICGAFASCDSQSTPICSCLKGFEPRNQQEWNRQNWTSGCVRRTLLQCDGATNQNTSVETKVDGFLTLQKIKVPDFIEASFAAQEDTCRVQCLKNCSCIAYSYDSAIGCMTWNGNLIDIQQFSSGGTNLYVRVAHTELGTQDKGRTTTVIITITVIIGTLIIVTCALVICRWAFKHKGETSDEYALDNVVGELSHPQLQELVLFKFEKLASSTNNFHLSNKLGQGGFGLVYKGELEGGLQIAVKRLSEVSGQGLEEFMNEVKVISKLQHRNLVRLLGCCIEENEKMLIYEYLPNKSLDAFIFDPTKSKLLDWKKRFSIIEGIARGLLYLHRDSRLKIIHRDLKASNILLDEKLNPKISDFGMARIFAGSQDQVNTRRVVGTYGYMSPEYAMQGLFSEKSDVFSFGILLLEIVSGKRNSSFYDDEHGLSLLGFAWIQWREENVLSLIDPGIYDIDLHTYILRCIHIGLLCVQEHAADRPNMTTILSMLNSEIVNLPPPRPPAFIRRENMFNSRTSKESNSSNSINNVSITDIHGR